MGRQGSHSLRAVPVRVALTGVTGAATSGHHSMFLRQDDDESIDTGEGCGIVERGPGRGRDALQPGAALRRNCLGLG